MSSSSKGHEADQYEEYGNDSLYVPVESVDPGSEATVLSLFDGGITALTESDTI